MLTGAPLASLGASVFISSTCKDMDCYRRAVEDAITRKAQVACFLSEEWAGGFDDTVQKCKDRVLNSFGFVLLLGYYYGWMPKGEASITQMEFEWAYQRWRKLPYPPMAVFAPKPASDAEAELRAEAEKYIPKDEQERELHAKRLESFRSQVLGAGRTAQFYSDRQELRENAIVACLIWKGQTPLAAAQSATGTAGGRWIGDEQLGSLGRKPQLDAIEDVLAQWYAEPDQPAVALLVHGDEDAGQRVFLSHLARTSHLDSYRPASPGHPPMDPYDVPVLTQWTARALGLPAAASELQDPQHLALHIAAELREQPLCFLLDRVQRLSGGVEAFVRSFWTPLCLRLKEIHAERALPNRLIAAVADYKGELTGAEPFLCAADARPADYALAIALPRLEAFKAKDVILWLNQVSAPDKPPGRRAQIAASVVKNAAGQPEGKPLRVYEQLRSIDVFQDSTP